MATLATLLRIVHIHTTLLIRYNLAIADCQEALANSRE